MKDAIMGMIPLGGCGATLFLKLLLCIFQRCKYLTRGLVPFEIADHASSANRKRFELPPVRE